MLNRPSQQSVTPSPRPRTASLHRREAAHRAKRLAHRLLLPAVLLLPGIPTQTQAACEGAAVVSANYCLYYPDTSTLGGDLQGGNHRLLAANMYPFQQTDSLADIAFWYLQALADLDAGKAFREGLLLIDGVQGDGTPIGALLDDPKANYASVGLLADLDQIAADLTRARDTFAYDVFIGYPDQATAQAKLLDSIKTLANIYLMVADEFLIDALEFRFSADTLGLDAKLDEQILLLDNARIHYELALTAFLSGFSPAVGSNVYASEWFDDNLWGLFQLAVERLGLALGEKSSKQLVRQMAPDPRQEWEAARAEALATLKAVNTSAYLTAAAIAHVQGADFDDAGAGSGMLGALSALRRQGNAYNQGLNPLGYDNRYVPMDDFSDLYSLATDRLNAATTAKAVLDAEKREFDANQQALRAQLDSLTNNHAVGLASLTGCPMPDPEDQAQVEAFTICTGEAGGDLFDCGLGLDPDGFDACVEAQTTGGTLAAKYRYLMDGQIRLNQARLRRENILRRIALENERHDRLVEMKRSFAGARTVLLDKYYQKLKHARTETDTITIANTRDRENHKWIKKSKTRNHSTVVSFAIKDEKLQLDTEQAKELLQITTDFEIQGVNLATAFAIKNLLLTEAEAEVESQLAAHQKNSALADFDHAFEQKENLWFAYQRALDQARYYTERTAALRVLRSQAAIDLAEAMNYAAHYGYLAAKALEYQYVTPLVNLSVPAGVLNITDLFKAQTPADMDEFLFKLNAWNTQACPWGTFDVQWHIVSLAYHILGLTDDYLDPDGDGLTDAGKDLDQARREGVQTFINEHINDQGHLEFAFTLSEGFSFLGQSEIFNRKIWHGAAPATCDTPPSEVHGVTVSLITVQGGNMRPTIRLKQIGHSSLKDEAEQIREYIPVSEYHFLFEGAGSYTPFRATELLAFVNVFDPRFEPGSGQWAGAFKGRGISSSDWRFELLDLSVFRDPTDLGKIRDILIHIDTLGENPGL